ncbi:hypothetical protein HY413_01490 [Candidatus Kaiserbacteria bacterium]|nr:hypothetical protein [Candidatus Kaiserbacteria bacterium]
MLILLYIACALAVLFVIFGFIALFAGPRGKGVSFVPTSRKRIETMLQLVGDVRGKRVVDLGSGDGRLVIAFASEGAEAHGYELNPVLVWLSRVRIILRGLQGRAHVHWGDYWRPDMSGFDIVVVYGFHSTMRELEKKLKRELSENALVLSNSFTFPTWVVAKEDGGIHMYRQGELSR